MCVLQSDLEEQVWVEEQEMFPCSYCVTTLAVGAVKTLQHEWVRPLGLLNYYHCEHM